MFGAVAVAGEVFFGGITFFDGAVEGLVGFDEFRGHGKGIVEVGEGATGGQVWSPRVEDGLRAAFDGGFLFVRRGLRPGKSVVRHGAGVTVIAFQPATDLPNPSHVHS